MVVRDNSYTHFLAYARPADGSSVGADEMVALATASGKAVWHSIDDIPPAS